MRYKILMFVAAALSSSQVSAGELQSVYVAPGGVYIANARVYVAPGPGNGEPPYVAPGAAYGAPGYGAPGYVAPAPAYGAPGYGAPGYAAPGPAYRAPAYYGAPDLHTPHRQFMASESRPIHPLMRQITCRGRPLRYPITAAVAASSISAMVAGDTVIEGLQNDGSNTGRPPDLSRSGPPMLMWTLPADQIPAASTATAPICDCGDARRSGGRRSQWRRYSECCAHPA